MSYRATSGAWDGGPPGAEADYSVPAPPAAGGFPAPALPATDPWTGVSYSHYGHPPNYDYQAYGQYAYGNYNANYYRQDGNYYPDNSSGYPAAAGGYDYPARPRERSRSPVASRSYADRRRSYSRSVSPYDKERTYSRKRDGSYEGGRRGRSRSKSAKSKRKYSSSDRSSSRSRSYSRSRNYKKRWDSASSGSSDKSYKKRKRGRGSTTPPLKSRRSRSRYTSTPSPKSDSKSPRLKVEREKVPKESKSGKRHREATTPPRKKSSEGTTPPRRAIKVERPSLTPPKTYIKTEPPDTPPKAAKQSSSKAKHRDSSVTPPRCYAPRGGRSSSNSKSGSGSPSPRRQRSGSRSSSSADRSRSRSRSRTPPKRRSRRSASAPRTPSRSRRRSATRSRSKSRGPKSKGKKRSASRSDSRSSRSRSKSGSASDDERRGQFTVADRKRFWKIHKSRQEERRSEKTPPKEVKPPPGAEDVVTKVDEIEYGVPPEVEGPNFAELLPGPDQLLAAASTSRAKNIPIPIKNDGSFLEMFKKMQEAAKRLEEEKKPEIKKPLPFIGKRRGGRVLKTGMVKKAKAIDEQSAESAPKDAWSLYMQEVKKYRETSCEEERKTRPLVK